MKEDDPAKGICTVTGHGECVVWSDASNTALAVVLEQNGSIIEDAAWLRKENDSRHINLVELEASIKGVNLAVSWGMSKITLRVDSKIACGWIRNALESKKRNQVKADSELLIRRKLCILKEIVPTE